MTLASDTKTAMAQIVALQVVELFPGITFASGNVVEEHIRIPVAPATLAMPDYDCHLVQVEVGRGEVDESQEAH